MQHCNGVTEFEQVENKAFKHVSRKRILSRRVMHGNGNSFAVR